MDLYQIFPQSANVNILKIPETGRKEDREKDGHKERRNSNEEIKEGQDRKEKLNAGRKEGMTQEQNNGKRNN